MLQGLVFTSRNHSDLSLTPLDFYLTNENEKPYYVVANTYLDKPEIFIYKIDIEDQLIVESFSLDLNNKYSQIEIIFEDKQDPNKFHMITYLNGKLTIIKINK